MTSTARLTVRVRVGVRSLMAILQTVCDGVVLMLDSVGRPNIWMETANVECPTVL